MCYHLLYGYFFRRVCFVIGKVKMSNSDSECGQNVSRCNVKKRKRTGRITEVMKKLRLQSHEEGQPCNCSRLKCFENINAEERKSILKHFNQLKSNDDQNAYLCGLMTLVPVQRRRSRKEEESAQFHSASYAYKIRVKRQDTVTEVAVCYKAFKSIHGITKGKLEFLQKSLKESGVSPTDGRGKHGHHKKLKEDIHAIVYDHINSFKARLSHYSMRDTQKKYLPEELNITKMFNMFKEKNSGVQVSYDSYKLIFNTKFNLSFGYPRTDTCSTCDEFNAKLRCLHAEKDALEIRELTLQNELHKRKAEAFYDRKRSAKRQSRKSSNYVTIAMDFQKNVYVPNISTNDVYWLRQLSLYSFNIHVLSTGQSLFYTYPQTIAKKGANEVISFLFHFITNHLDEKTTHLHIFCDSAGGQNKNFAMFKFMHYIVHSAKLLESIKITYPERGHSYLECDKNMGLVNLKTRMEHPDEWIDVLKSSRSRPAPFEVINVSQNIVKEWDSFLAPRYLKKCPFPIQKIKEIESTLQHPRLVHHKATFNGSWFSNPILQVNKKMSAKPVLQETEFELPCQAYSGIIS